MRVPLRVVLPILALTALGGCAEHAPIAIGACPAWPDYPRDLHSNDGSPYLGCTNASNLNAMVVDKRDLKAGRALGPANGARESKAVEDYEAGKIALPSSTGTTDTAAPAPPTNPQGTQGTQ